MTITNHTTAPDKLINKIIENAIDAFHALYPVQTYTSELILCESKEDFDRISREIVSENIPEDIRNYDGRFICPQSKPEKYQIILLLKDDVLSGAEQYLSELENGTLRNAEMTQAERESRGMGRRIQNENSVRKKTERV